MTIHLDNPYLGMLPIIKPTNKIALLSTKLLGIFDNLNHEFTNFLFSLNSDQRTTLSDAQLTDIGSLLLIESSKKYPGKVFQLISSDPFYRVLQTSYARISRLQSKLNSDIYRLYKLNRSDVAQIKLLLCGQCD